MAEFIQQCAPDSPLVMTCPTDARLVNTYCQPQGCCPPGWPTLIPPDASLPGFQLTLSGFSGLCCTPQQAITHDGRGVAWGAFSRVFRSDDPYWRWVGGGCTDRTEFDMAGYSMQFTIRLDEIAAPPAWGRARDICSPTGGRFVYAMFGWLDVYQRAVDPIGPWWLLSLYLNAGTQSTPPYGISATYWAAAISGPCPGAPSILSGPNELRCPDPENEVYTHWSNSTGPILATTGAATLEYAP